MFGRKLLAALLLVGILSTQFALPAAADTTCDWAQFVSDLTVPDGTSFAPGTPFTKTWRLTNIGSCTWNTSYQLVFVNGEQMGAPTAVNMPVEVVTGQMVDISVSMIAPAMSGNYRSYWSLRNVSGAQFGIGSTASDPIWVDINVVETKAVVFDFVVNAPYAQWKSGASPLPFPGTSGDRRGYAYRLDNPHLEDDSISNEPGLLTVPQNRYNGYIQATYPEFLVQQGDRLQTLVNCEFGAKGCYVTFQINYINPNGYVGTLWSWKEAYEGRFYRADIDISRFAGQKIKFILVLLSNGLASNDRAIWGAPRIVRTGSVAPPAPPATLTPLPALTSTPTPFDSPPPISSSGCDQASFVQDVTIPDGTPFAPGAAFSKTWRLKNSGLCTWTTSYSLLFYNGEQMGAPTAINMPTTVYPGAGVDLTVNMVAPSSPGEYRGFWILRNANGALFGLGKDADMPFWVEITVTGASPIVAGYDFVANACSAQWKSGAGPLPCPGTDGDRNGYVINQSSTQLEDGTRGPAPSLLVAPQYKYNGYIQGFYPTFTVKPGDRFRTNIGCAYGSNCYVTFMLQYMNENGWVGTLGTWKEQNEGRVYNVDLDLSPLAGRSVRFILTLLATGYATNDRAVWTAPYIIRADVPPSTTPTPTLAATPTPTSTPTLTPPPVSDWPTYTNTKYGFQFRYPPEGQITIELEGAVHIVLPIVPGTNLSRKYLDVIVAENADPCRSPLATASMLETSETVILNGTPFLKETGKDAAAGSLYKWVAYSTQRDNVCVSLDFILHSLNPGNFTTPPPIYDEALEKAVFDVMVSTFTWLSVPPTSTSTPTLIPAATDTPTPTQTPAAPPTSDWLTFTNNNYSFEFKYPPGGQIVQGDGITSVMITLPFQPGTNLVEKYLDLRVLENATSCAHPTVGEPMNPETVVLNGITFVKGSGSDQGAGQIRKWTTYATTRGNVCVVFLFVLHSGNPDNYYPTPPPLYDEVLESAVFEQIVSTYTWLTLPPTDTPTPTPTSTPQVSLQGPYAVVRVNSSDVLNVRENAGVNSAIVGSFPSNATNIMRTGPSQQVDGGQWVQVQRSDGGLGWVNAFYLTEYVSHDAFCADSRIPPMVAQLREAVNLSNGEQFAASVSPIHGLEVRLWAYSNSVNFSKEKVKTIFTSSEVYNWGGGPSGTPDVGTFAAVIQPKLSDVLNAPNREIYCDNLTKVYPLSTPWPYPNIRFYNIYKPASASDTLDFRTWLIGFEYINNQPVLYSMVTIVWEP